MLTVHEVSELTGVSIRTLHHYDQIGLLPASKVTDAGYRLYDDTALERLQQILLFRELEFPLKDIREILQSPDFDRDKALTQQIELLELRRDHLQGLIDLAREMQTTGETNMSFKAFDREKMDAYAEQAKASWGKTDAYREYEEKAGKRTEQESRNINEGLMDIFREFGEIRTQAPDSPEAIALADKLQSYITANYYRCTDEILRGLGTMYAAGGEFTENIDAAGGAGTACFAKDAIEAKLSR